MFKFIEKVIRPRKQAEQETASDAPSIFSMPEMSQVEHKQTAREGPSGFVRTVSVVKNTPAIESPPNSTDVPDSRINPPPTTPLSPPPTGNVLDSSLRHHGPRIDPPPTASPSPLAGEVPHTSIRHRFEEKARREDPLYGYSVKRLEHRATPNGLPIYAFVIKFADRFSVRNTYKVHDALRETHVDMDPSGLLIHIYDAKELQIRIGDAGWYLKVFADAIRGKNPLSTVKASGKRIYILRPGGKREDQVVDIIRHQTQGSLGAVSMISSATVDEILVSIEQYLLDIQKQSAHPH